MTVCIYFTKYISLASRAEIPWSNNELQMFLSCMTDESRWSYTVRPKSLMATQRNQETSKCDQEKLKTPKKTTRHNTAQTQQGAPSPPARNQMLPNLSALWDESHQSLTTETSLVAEHLIFYYRKQRWFSFIHLFNVYGLNTRGIWEGDTGGEIPHRWDTLGKLVSRHRKKGHWISK